MSFGAEAPDYKGAAEAQGQSSVDAINAQTTANRPDINTPWGSQTWENDGGNWTMNVNLSPDQQAALDSQQRIGAGRSQMAEDMLGQAGADLANGIDWDGLGTMQDGTAAREAATTAAYDQMTSRLDPQWQQRGDALDSKLANMGITDMGSDPYQQAMGNFGRDRNDAYDTAMRSSIREGVNAGNIDFNNNLRSRQQDISEAFQQQYGGINALNAFLSGQQVSMPQMPGFSQAGAAQPVNYLGAANMTGQNNIAQQQLYADMIGGGAQLAGSAIPFMF